MPTHIRKINPLDLEENKDVAVGIMLPMVDTDGSLFKLSYTTEEQAISNLKNLLLTSLGERIMEPLFGTNIQKSLFEQITDLLLDNIVNSVRKAIEYWLPYIKLNNIAAYEVESDSTNMGEHGIYLYLLVQVSEQGANIPITIFYTPTVAQVITNEQV
jgi:phage baseplate assembly protein W